MDWSFSMLIPIFQSKHIAFLFEGINVCVNNFVSIRRLCRHYAFQKMVLKRLKSKICLNHNHYGFIIYQLSAIIGFHSILSPQKFNLKIFPSIMTLVWIGIKKMKARDLILEFKNNVKIQIMIFGSFRFYPLISCVSIEIQLWKEMTQYQNSMWVGWNFYFWK